MSARSGRLTAAVVAVSCAAACLAPARVPLRVGVNAWPGYEYLYLADVKDFYAAEGVEVRLLEFGSLSDTRRAYERGQLDMMGATVIEGLVIHDASPRRPRVVRVVDYSNGPDVIIAQPWITRGEQLRGARVGVELAALPVFLLARGLEDFGLTVRDVRTASMDQTAMEEAFRRGDLDAVVTYPPTSVRLTREMETTRLFSSADAPREILDVLLAEADVVRDRGDEVRALLRAFDRAVAYAERQPADAAAIMAQREGITPGEFSAALSGGIVLVGADQQAPFFGPDGALERAIRVAGRLLVAAGQLRAVPAPGSLVEPRFIGEARP